MLKEILLCSRDSARTGGHKQFFFRSGYHVIVGPNGSGKSSLLQAIYRCRECEKRETGKTRYHYFNGELMNPHRNPSLFRGPVGSIVQVRGMFSSHGETMRDVLGTISFREGECFLLDEPETGHDLEWILRIRKGLNLMAAKGCQVIVATHHPVFWCKADLTELKRSYLKKMVKKFQNVVRIAPKLEKNR